ncbi:KRAB-A domain-containing protein 2 [Trichonephila clavipes]|nr:KRAB-A domain-containing protein 2 [Trichonephila clavipes]
MVYQDHLTKFVQLRLMKTKRALETAYHVLSIFLTFGAPAILQSDNGREFSNQFISEICTMWKDIKMVHGKPRHSQTQGSVKRANQDIQNAWMNDNYTNKCQQIASIEIEEQLEEIAKTFETEEQLEETEHRTPDGKAWVQCPMPSNTLRVHMEYVLIKLVGPKVSWAESRVQGTGECFPPLQSHGKIVEVEIRSVAIYCPFGEFRQANSYCHLCGAQGLGQRQAYF